jgi:hypothetical protein
MKISAMIGRLIFTIEIVEQINQLAAPIVGSFRMLSPTTGQRQPRIAVIDREALATGTVFPPCKK